MDVIKFVGEIPFVFCVVNLEATIGRYTFL